MHYGWRYELEHVLIVICVEFSKNLRITSESRKGAFSKPCDITKYRPRSHNVPEGLGVVKEFVGNLTPV